ncbi:MAG: proteasome-type protease [Burkholderiales bacterium]|nr:MAG: proteasome-type protease [Burkholderiales bacterium]
MTFCIGIRIDSGLIALADTQIVRGEQVSSKAKLSMIAVGEHRLFLMTSGLRSVRDKAVSRLEDRLAAMPEPFNRAHQLASAFGDALREVRAEDEATLVAGGLSFNLHAIIGGRLRGDAGTCLFQVFPECNWISATQDSPYFVIGRSHFGKPILDRLLSHRTPLRTALALAYLAFDATRASVVDVDFPIDVVADDGTGAGFRQHRFTAEDLAVARDGWHAELERSLGAFPMDWADPLWRERAGE